MFSPYIYKRGVLQIMARKKNTENSIELGILENYSVEDEAIIEEEIPAEECLTITEAKIIRVAEGELWININDLCFSIVTAKMEPWMVKGATAYVMHEGTPGKADFKIAGMKE